MKINYLVLLCFVILAACKSVIEEPEPDPDVEIKPLTETTDVKFTADKDAIFNF